MSGDELPAEWAQLCEKASIRASLNGIAEAAGTYPSTISRLVTTGRTTAKTVEAVATALRVSAQTIWDMVGQGGTPGLGRWEPPEEAHDLDKESRKVLNDLIRVMAKGATDGPANPAEKSPPDGGDGGGVTPIRPAGWTPEWADVPDAARRSRHKPKPNRVEDENQDAGE